MAEKRYYWLKLQKDFFKRHDIKIVESMPNGKDYVLFYLKMLVESIDHEGALRFSDTIPYNADMLATITNTNVDVVRSALKIFAELHMIQMLDDQTIYMSECERLVGGESWSAQRTRKYRERLSASQAVTETSQAVTCDEEIEKEIELDKELEIEGDKKTKRKRFAPPTLEELENYITEKNYNVNADKFFNYYESNGWMVGRNKMKSWKAAVAKWNADNDGKSTAQKTSSGFASVAGDW